MARKSSQDGPALTHIDATGEARMVDVSTKPATERTAVAEGRAGSQKEDVAVLEGIGRGLVGRGKLRDVKQAEPVRIVFVAGAGMGPAEQRDHDGDGI